ncbi:MAG: 50S ribosomal protein L28 [Candidatus Riflebacteria bacterium]|nr:50S ribosomal protein L28 [Candidatus Riflebacteria bacterium]
MATSCYVCHKTSSVGMAVSHSHIRTKRRWRPNLQNFKTKIAGRVMTIRVCTKCIKAGKVLKVH